MTYAPGQPPDRGNPFGVLAVLVALVAMFAVLIAVGVWALS